MAINFDGTAEELLATEGVQASPPKRAPRQCLPTFSDLSMASDVLQRVFPVRYLHSPVTPKTADEPAGSMSPLLSVSASQLLDNPDERNSTVLRRNHQKARRALPPASAYSKDVFGPHVQTGIDKLQAAGQLGAGVKVGSLRASRFVLSFVAYLHSITDWNH